MLLSEEDYLEHYGILRRSGRYPWGTGGTQNTRNKAFLDYVETMRREGLTEVQIAEGVGISTTQLRAAKSIAKNQQKQMNINQAQKLKDKGYSNVAIGEKMGINESSVRALLAPGVKEKADILITTSDMLKDQVAKKGLVDIGGGVENHVGISKEKLAAAVSILKEEGYVVHSVPVPQLGTGKDTNTKVLAPPGTTWGDVAKNKADIKQITDFSEDGGRTYFGLHEPLKLDPKRVGIRYAEDGGREADGVIYVRPGVEDVSLGGSRYAQVRVSVGDSHYIKGMAMYKDDLPDGIDVQFNTNKSDTGNKLDALKPLKEDSANPGRPDPDNPYGAVISRQIVAVGKDGKERTTSAMNIVNEEGAWGKWSKNIASQVLSKQTPSLAKSQLDMTYERRKIEFDGINALTNPTVKRKLLLEFADSADSASVHLKAAALPRQGTHVILPIASMPPTQIYAPNYRDGETVALVRYPHAGTFEIPELKVNNNHPEAKRLLGGARDAVGIHSSVAERLSGADFDGDTVLVIPNGGPKRLKTTAALEGLKGFDARTAYPEYPGMKVMSERTKQIEMGSVSNLITDMTIHGASGPELARAVKHSMVVIDGAKHKLDYKQSALDNGITQLKAKYQGTSRGGASTLISRATSEQRVVDRKPRLAKDGGPIDKVTGQRVYVPTDKTYVNRQGDTVRKTVRSTKLAEVDDAFVLSSGTPIERVYASHSNKLKSLADQARLRAINTPPSKYSPSAKKVYEEQVKSLNAKLDLANRNRPLERQAQIIAGSVVKAKKASDPSMSKETLKKIEGQALNEARNRTGARKTRVEFSDTEWEAIQAGAISNDKLSKILDSADMDRVRELATPRSALLMSTAKTSRAASMLASGYTRAEVADALGVSITTLDAGVEA